MARPKKIISMTAQIEKAEELVLKTKTAYDEAVAALKLLREKEEQEKQEALLNAAAHSKRSYDEIMKYLQSDPAEDDE